MNIFSLLYAFVVIVGSLSVLSYLLQHHGLLGDAQARILDGLPFPAPEDLPNPGIEPHISFVSCIAGRFFTV